MEALNFSENFKNGLGVPSASARALEESSSMAVEECSSDNGRSSPTLSPTKKNDLLANGEYVIRPPSHNSFDASLPSPVFKSLRPKHIRILKLHLSGRFKRYEIAELVNCSMPTITNVINSPAAQKIIRGGIKDIERDFEGMLSLVVETLRDTLNYADRETKLKAVGHYTNMLRAKNPTTKKIELSGPNGGPIHVENAKARLLERFGIDPNKIIASEQEVIDAEFTEVGA